MKAQELTPEQNTRSRKKRIALTASIMFLVLVAGLVVGAFVSPSFTKHNENMLMHGVVTVTVKDANGTVVSQTRNDTIYSVSYDYIMCYLWGTGCSGVSALTFPQTTFTTTATVSQFTPYMTFLDGIALSSGSQSTGACTNQIAGSGLAPENAGTIHNTGTNQILLTASWTATASINVQSVCLIAATNNAFIPQFTSTPLSSTTSFASENFSVQSLTSGQSITIQWTFSF